MNYSVENLICDYGVFYKDELIPYMVTSSKANALLIAEIMNFDDNNVINGIAYTRPYNLLQSFFPKIEKFTDKSFLEIYADIKEEILEAETELSKIFCIGKNNWVEYALENLDTIQVHMTMLYKLQDEGHINIKELLEKHKNKVLGRNGKRSARHYEKN